MRERLSTSTTDKPVVVFVLTSRLRRQSEGDFHSSHNPEQTLEDSSKMRTRSSTHPKLLDPPPLQRNLRPSHLRNGERAQRHGDGGQVDQQQTGSNSARHHIASFRHCPSVQRFPDPSPTTLPPVPRRAPPSSPSSSPASPPAMRPAETTAAVSRAPPSATLKPSQPALDNDSSTLTTDSPTLIFYSHTRTHAPSLAVTSLPHLQYRSPPNPQKPPPASSGS
jgi:hypothetical protein